jgi:uncharacterized protein (DUF58 family)
MTASSRLWRALAKRLQPPRTLRPTRAGWWFCALSFGVGVAALNTGNNLLYLVLSLMLAFLVLSGLLSESALRGIEVRRLLPREIFAGTPARVVLEIRNAQRRNTAFAVAIEDCVAAERGSSPCGRCFALRVAPQATLQRSYALRAAKRGELHFAGFRVHTRFPFGLFSKSLRIEAPESALVYPEVETVSALRSLGRAREGEIEDAGRGTRGALAAGLREYRPGDPARRIHWRASQRRAELLVRELESESAREVEVRLRTANSASGENFERAVCWAASEIVAWLEAGTRVALRTDRETLPAAHGAEQRARLLAYLARIAPDADALRT